jgi:hypothetical protein
MSRAEPERPFGSAEDLRRFQRQHFLLPSGRMDRATVRALEELAEGGRMASADRPIYWARAHLGTPRPAPTQAEIARLAPFRGRLLCLPRPPAGDRLAAALEALAPEAVALPDPAALPPGPTPLLLGSLPLERPWEEARRLADRLANARGLVLRTPPEAWSRLVAEPDLLRDFAAALAARISLPWAPLALASRRRFSVAARQAWPAWAGCEAVLPLVPGLYPIAPEASTGRAVAEWTTATKLRCWRIAPVWDEPRPALIRRYRRWMHSRGYPGWGWYGEPTPEVVAAFAAPLDDAPILDFD